MSDSEVLGPQPLPKFVQIAVQPSVVLPGEDRDGNARLTDAVVFALDADGDVWALQDPQQTHDNRWRKCPTERER